MNDETLAVSWDHNVEPPVPYVCDVFTAGDGQPGIRILGSDASLILMWAEIERQRAELRVVRDEAEALRAVLRELVLAVGEEDPDGGWSQRLMSASSAARSVLAGEDPLCWPEPECMWCADTRRTLAATADVARVVRDSLDEMTRLWQEAEAEVVRQCLAAKRATELLGTTQAHWEQSSASYESTIEVLRAELRVVRDERDRARSAVRQTIEWWEDDEANGAAFDVLLGGDPAGTESGDSGGDQ